MTGKILRQDQETLKDGVYSDWKNDAKNVLAVLSTGGGKSVIMSKIALDGAREGLQQNIIAHRNELVAQMSGHIAERGIPHRIIAPQKIITQITKQHRELFGRSYVNPSAPTSVMGVDTVKARAKELKDFLRQTCRWFIDEGHHVLLENKWGIVSEMMPNAQGLGVTATAIRADGKGLGREYDGVYDSMVVGLDMRSLIKINALSDYEIVCPKSDLELSDDDIGASGDWSPTTMRKAVKKTNNRIVGDTVSNYCKFAYGRQAICFATDVETAGEIAARFNDKGIRAAALSGDTNADVRDKYIREFKAGKLMVLVNVDLFDEGFDVPACDVVIMARPTASLGKYRQMIGRALRYLAGKIALIIDQVSNVVRHGLPDKFVTWSLARRDKRGSQSIDPDEIMLTTCKYCTKPYERFRHICPYCGMMPPLPEPRERTLEMVDGDLTLLTREMLEEMRRATELETPADIGGRVAAVAGEFAGKRAIQNQIDKYHAQQRLTYAIEQWAGVQRFNGFDDRAIHKKFYIALGVTVHGALNGTRTRQEFEETAAIIEGWYT